MKTKPNPSYKNAKPEVFVQDLLTGVMRKASAVLPYPDKTVPRYEFSNGQWVRVRSGAF